MSNNKIKKNNKFNKINDDYWKYKQSRKTNEIIYLKYPDDPKRKRKIAIIVPYRNDPKDNMRKRHLDTFYAHMVNFLKGYKYKIFIIEQSDDNKRFNRGMLLNIGIAIAIEKKYKILITHDVDLLPKDNVLNYYLTRYKYPVHIAWQWKTKYTFNEYFGGIVSFTPKIAKTINGYPNNFWGWGGEDDSFYNRVADTIGKIGRPVIGDIDDIEHEGPTKQTINDKKKENILNDIKLWEDNGLNNIKYKIINKERDSNYIKITVQLD
jgi:beta-1,4-galactosyltransferase 1